MNSSSTQAQSGLIPKKIHGSLLPSDNPFADYNKVEVPAQPTNGTSQGQRFWDVGNDIDNSMLES